MKSFLLLMSCLFFSFSSFAQYNRQIDAIIESNYGNWEMVYRDYHMNPELSFMEKETSAKLAVQLRDLGFKVTENIGGYGVVAVFKNGSGPVVMVRADMDALPKRNLFMQLWKQCPSK